MGFFSCGFKFVRVDFGASKELIETRQEGKCEEKSFPTHPPLLKGLGCNGEWNVGDEYKVGDKYKAIEASRRSTVNASEPTESVRLV